MIDKRNDLDIIDGLIEMGKTAPELCPSCKYLEIKPFKPPTIRPSNIILWDKWCRRLTTSVERVWLCTAYEQETEQS